ncbi:MAG TPA: hypothetical protein VJ868_06795 [Actinomycetota bacterium]|nr:hypothetical protein [Actinomycetota bacterium]
MARGLGEYAMDFFRNWRESEEPLGRKLSKTARNRIRALGGGCCGHHGEPGC